MTAEARVTKVWRGTETTWITVDVDGIPVEVAVDHREVEQLAVTATLNKSRKSRSGPATARAPRPAGVRRAA